MKLHLIYARARNGTIGKDNQMPWHLPEDLAHFKRVTLGQPVIMGRKTWDSLPARFRPLPGRTNIVITRQPDWHADGASRAASIEEAMQLCGDVPDAWIMGGAEIYRLFLPHADRIELTEVHLNATGDTRLDPLGPDWVEVARTSHVAEGERPAFDFVTLKRRG